MSEQGDGEITKSTDSSYLIHDDPTVVTDDAKAAQAAKDLGYEVTEIKE